MLRANRKSRRHWPAGETHNEEKFISEYQENRKGRKKGTPAMMAVVETGGVYYTAVAVVHYCHYWRDDNLSGGIGVVVRVRAALTAGKKNVHPLSTASCWCPGGQTLFVDATV